jgi:hypothetical protein
MAQQDERALVRMSDLRAMHDPVMFAPSSQRSIAGGDCRMSDTVTHQRPRKGWADAAATVASKVASGFGDGRAGGRQREHDEGFLR